MKRCPRCEVEQPTTSFAKNSARKDGLQIYCRTCVRKINRAYYVKTPEKNDERREGARRLTERNRVYIYEYLQTHPCVDCGISDWRVLQFDHTGDDKIKDISAFIRSYSLDKLKAEVLKCEVRCANCHQIKTAERAGSWRSSHMGL